MIIERESYITKIYSALNQVSIVVLIGARQVGKTTLMKSFKTKGKSLFLNGQNPEIIEQFKKYSTIEKYLQINLDNKLYGTLFIDEFQFIPDISTLLKLLVDTNDKLKIICSGSSSLDISQSVSESLAGRVRIIPVYSLSFVEYIKFIDKDLYEKFSKYKQTDDLAIISKTIPILLNEYLVYGSLPRIALARNPKDKIELLDDIYQTYLLNDVRNYVKNKDFVAFKRLLRLLSAQIGNLVNINELSLLSKLSYRKCEEYFNLLEQMHIIKNVHPYNTNKRKEITKMKKTYFYDLGIRNIVYNSFNDIEIRIDNGALFENFVYLELAKHISKSRNIYFYRTKDGLEIEFIIEQDQKLIPFEVKFRNIEKHGNEGTLNRFLNIINYSQAFFINKNNNSLNGKIQYVPGYFISKVEI